MTINERPPDECPLCGKDFVVRVPANAGQIYLACATPSCGLLPVRNWREVQKLKDENQALRHVIGIEASARIVDHGPGWYLSDTAGGQRSRVCLMHDELQELQQLRARIAELEAGVPTTGVTDTKPTILAQKDDA